VQLKQEELQEAADAQDKALQVGQPQQLVQYSRNPAGVKQDWLQGMRCSGHLLFACCRPSGGAALLLCSCSFACFKPCPAGCCPTLQVQRFQQWQSEHKVAKKQAEQLADVQDALMTQLAVQEADERVSAYSQLLLEETQQRGLSTQPVALHVVRAAKQRSALTPSM
jgi:Trp operon repressor